MLLILAQRSCGKGVQGLLLVNNSEDAGEQPSLDMSRNSRMVRGSTTPGEELLFTESETVLSVNKELLQETAWVHQGRDSASDSSLNKLLLLLLGPDL